MKTKERLEARRLRIKEQLPLREIATRLGVSKSTVSGWVRDLPLSQEVIEARCMVGCIKGAKTRHDNARAVREQYQQSGREMMDSLRDEPLFVAGCMMHWAEGDKEKNSASISNTDKHFLIVWLMFVEQFFGVHASDVVLHIHCYLNNGKTRRQIESYWLKELGLPRSSLRKTTVVTNHRFSTGVKKNRHPYGVGGIKVHSTEIIQQIWGAIKSYAHIDDDRWLD